MKDNSKIQKSSLLDLLPDEILILPSIILVIDSFITGEFMNVLTIIFLIPLVLLFLTYLQRRKVNSFVNLKLYGIRQVIFGLLFLLMFLGGIGFAMQLAGGERLFADTLYILDILVVIGYIFTAIVFYRYGDYVKSLKRQMDNNRQRHGSSSIGRPEHFNIIFMKKFLTITLLVLPLLYLMQERIRGIYYLLIYSKEQILSQQVLGDGCGYQHLCDYSIYWFSGGNIRNNDYYCPMMAADCMQKLKIEGHIAIPILKQALSKKKAVYDTGDGVINYKNHLETVITEMESNEFENAK